jgi:hypothetical protein
MLHAFESPSRFARTVVYSGYALWEGSCNDRTDLLRFEIRTLPTCASWLQLWAILFKLRYRASDGGGLKQRPAIQ